MQGSSSSDRPLPSGTVTFLMTDVEGSGPHWEDDATAMEADVAQYTAIAVDQILGHGGAIVRTRGEADSIFAAFQHASDAAAAAIAFQRELNAQNLSLRVRVGMNTGEAQLRDGDYYGTAVNRCARVRAIGHGGQILLAGSTGELAQRHLPGDASLRLIGEHRLKDLARPERIFQVLAPGLRPDFPPLNSLDAHPNNLPHQLTSFIGRDDEKGEAGRLLAGARLLTLAGAGGCGKTRLALQVAADRVEEYPHGVWLVELAALADPDLVPPTVAATLHLREAPGRAMTETLVDYLQLKEALLLLDNCEHLVAACATLCATLLRACPHLRILATSREPLGVPGEHVYRVPSLSLPGVGRWVSGVGAEGLAFPPDTRHPTPSSSPKRSASSSTARP